MSALARILLHQGREVSGSDSNESHITKDLQSRGAKVSIGQSPKNVEGASAVVFSDAIDLETNTEAHAARSLGLPCFRRSQLLGFLVNDKRLIAITGTHGKTTTTAMLSKILEDARLDPLAIIGADVAGFEGNVRFGNGEWAVVEACEAYDSFHDLQPEIVVLTNLEPDHLDFHGTWENLRDSVKKFVDSAKGQIPLVYCDEDSGANELHDLIGKGIGYGLKEAANVNPILPGVHNRLNAAAAVKTAGLLGVSESSAIRSVSAALGPERRLEQIGEYGGISVVDDYAHHPTEIRASISALREKFAGRRLVVVFQPHLYSRTRDFLAQFSIALSDADVIVLTDIYPAREDPIPGISSAVIVEQLEKLRKTVRYIPVRHLLAREVSAIAKEADVVVGMGAGNIESFAREFLSELKRIESPLHVGIFCGGESAEREVSRLSGMMVANALRMKGYRTSIWDPSEMLLGNSGIDALRGPDRPDMVFLALHGTGGEDGRIQGLLELMHLPYVGAGLESSAQCMDKVATKQVLAANGIPVPSGVVVKRGEPVPQVSYPAVVKPNAQGSTIGLGFANNSDELAKCLETAFKYDESVLVEEQIIGTEISVPILVDKPLPAVEIVPASGTYDYLAKYTPGATEEIVPARISESEEKEARRIALECHKLMKCDDFSRTDMIVTNKGIVVLEINTLPGMTSTSLLPKSALAAGITFEELCETILISALNRYGNKKKKE